MLFDPVKTVTFISLAAASIWAMCYMKDAKRRTQCLTLIVTLVALTLAACLEWSHHVDPCDRAPKLLINEFCAEGRQCAGGKDFVEIINPATESVDLGCYALTDRRSAGASVTMPGNPFLLPSGQSLQPGEVRAWDAVDTRFQLSWRETDRLQLGRIRLLPGEPWGFEPLDDVSIDSNHSYGIRTRNDGDPWRFLSHEEAKRRSELGTFNRSNGDLP
jgi:hypothetical protein